MIGVHAQKCRDAMGYDATPCEIAEWLRDGNNNALIAKQIWDGQGYGAWSTFNVGSHIPYLPEAREAVAIVLPEYGGPGPAPAPAPAPPPPPPSSPPDVGPQPGTFYTVKSGDTLSSISAEAYGTPDDWPVIYAHNAPNIPDPNVIYAGQIFYIPTVDQVHEYWDAQNQPVPPGTPEPSPVPPPPPPPSPTPPPPSIPDDTTADGYVTKSQMGSVMRDIGKSFNDLADTIDRS